MAETILQILQWAIPSGGIGAAIAWIANRKAASAKTAKAVHDTYKTMYEDISQLLVENQKKNEKTINSLQEELDKARTESARIKRSLDRLSRAIEAIQHCPHRINCPISSELSLDEEADTGKPQRTKHRTTRQRGGEHQHTADAAREGADVSSEPDTQSGHTSSAASRSELHSTAGTGKSESKS